MTLNQSEEVFWWVLHSIGCDGGRIQDVEILKHLLDPVLPAWQSPFLMILKRVGTGAATMVDVAALEKISAYEN